MGRQCRCAERDRSGIALRAALLHRATSPCPGGFYTYAAFLDAARAFPGFANQGSAEDRKREVAAFLANISHETTGGWATAPDGPYSWGLCFVREGGNIDPSTLNAYCVSSAQYPRAAGKKYYGRGPIQLSYNYNYGQAGVALGIDLLNNPDLVATDPVVSFKTALWFWMTAQAPKPSCHDVMTGQFQPSAADFGRGTQGGLRPDRQHHQRRRRVQSADPGAGHGSRWLLSALLPDPRRHPRQRAVLRQDAELLRAPIKTS